MNRAYGHLGSASLSLGYGLLDSARTGFASGKQVARAVAGQKLTDYKNAEDISLFWYAPPSDEMAFYKAAYWLAVAARLGGAQLASTATSYQARGQATAALPFSETLFTGGKEAILLDAGKQVAAVAGSNKQLQAVAKILGVLATQALAAQQRAHDQSLTGQAIDAASDTTLMFMCPINPAFPGCKESGRGTRPLWFWPVVVGIPALILLTELVRSGGARQAARYSRQVYEGARATRRELTGPRQKALTVSNRRRAARQRRRA